jgi:IclR family acetate operon transcriptional repressor
LIGTLVDDHGVVIEQVPSDQPVKCLIRIGHQFPLHSAAPAKAMLAFLPEAEREAIVARMTFPRFTERTITDPDRYREELTEARRLGYALDRGEELSDLTCAAAPVLNHRGYPIAGIWVTGPASRMPIDQLPKIGELVAEHVASVSMRFGYVVGEEETGDPALSTSADR